MSEVKKSEPFVYWADCADPDQSAMCWHKEDALTQINDHGGTLYELSHTSELDAQRLRADTAEVQLAEKREEYNKLADRYDAAEQRIASMSELFKKFFEFVEMAPVSSGVCCCGCDTSQTNHGDHMAVDQWDHSVSLWGREIDAALNPKPEAGSHEVAREALKMENQRIVPARFKCLACGDYHEGSGNLPCPKTIPYAGV